MRMTRTRKVRLIGSVTVGLLAGLLPATLPVGAAHMTNTEELEATDNIGAAIAFSKVTFPDGATEAALGRDDTFPDSLASGLLQASRPLLLTKTDALDDATKAELARLKVTKVYILGGIAAVSEDVKTALEAEGYTTQRISGSGRVETAVEVAKAIGAAAESAIVARAAGDAEDESRGFADSLAAGGWAASADMPVLLTDTAQLSQATGDYIKSSSIKTVYVVGGRAAVSDTTMTQLAALGLTVERISGPTRFHTAVAIAVKRGFAAAKDATKVILTEGQDPSAWAAGFSAAALSKKDNAPIVLSVGAEVPEPTTTFLTGEEGDPSAALVCSSSVASESCDLAAEALGQVASDGVEGPITFESTTVSRNDYLVGTVANARTVNEVKATGCGYTDEPVFMEKTGKIYLLMTADQGTCSLEFALTTSAGVTRVSQEIAIGDLFAFGGVLPIPELVSVRPVKTTEEGVVLRFIFDEPIAPGAEIDHTKFYLLDYTGKPTATGSALPTSIQRDPRYSSAVLAVFRSAQYEKSVVAAVGGGLVCGNGTKVTGGRCDTVTPPADPGTQIFKGAVRDIDGYPNPTGHFGIRTFDRTQSASDAPDLILVGDFDSTTQSLLFTFSEAVKVPANTLVGAATVLLKDGTIKRSNANGFSAGPTTDSLWVSFSGDGISAAESEQLRRGFVNKGVVTEEDSAGKPNTPTTAIIAGGGISDLPDFINIDSVDLTNQKVTYVFEEPLDAVNEVLGIDTASTVGSAFLAVNSAGVTVYPPFYSGCTGAEDTCTLNKPTLSDDKKKVTVTFKPPTTGFCATPTSDKCKGGGLDNTVLYYTVRTGAVKSFSSQKWSFADTIRVAAPEVYPPGNTRGPDLTQVKTRFTPRTCAIGIDAGTPAKLEISMKFDATIVVPAAPPPANTPDRGFFHLWYTTASGAPRTTEFVLGTTAAARTFVASANSSEAKRELTGTNCDNAGGGGTFTADSGGAEQAMVDTGNDAGKTNIVYMAVQLNGAGGTGNATWTYMAGMRVPN